MWNHNPLEMTPSEAYKALVKGFNVLECIDPHVPSELFLNGEKAFPVLVSPKGQVLIAASQYGKGRVVVISHEGYLKSPSFAPFLQNVVKWLKPSQDALIGIHESFDWLLKTLTGYENRVQSSTEFSGSFGVYCMNAYDDRQSRDIILSLKQGAGLLIGGQAWSWSQVHGFGNVMAAFPGNSVTRVAGIHFTGIIGETGIFPLTTEMPINPVFVQHGKDLANDLKVLLKDVSELCLEHSGIPSLLLLHGATAFPVGLQETLHTFLAASHYGNGRVVVAAHERQLDSPKMKRFILNAIEWLAAGRQGKIGVGRSLKGLQTILLQENIACELSDLKTDYPVYCCNATNGEVEKILEFVAEGGGLLVGGQAWWWARENPGHDEISEFPGNKMINPFGISILGSHMKAATYKTLSAEEAGQHYHFRKALCLLLQQIGSGKDFQEPLIAWLKKLGSDCLAILRTAEVHSQVFSPIHQTILKLLQETGIPEVSRRHPIKGSSKEAFLLRLAAGLHYMTAYFDTSIKKLIKTSQDLPVSSSETIQIDGTSKGSDAWRSTGLYLAPGNPATIEFPDDALSAGLQVQVGCHSDDLKDVGYLKRPPLAIERYSVNKKVLSVFSVWGGLVYIIVPQGRQLGQVSLTIQGAVLAPFYKRGETSNASWKDTIRHYPAPWAELATDNIILTVPADKVRSLDNPEELLCLWDRMMKAVTELSAIPFPFARPERIVADVQLASSYMHSGYPIMGVLESVNNLVDTNKIQSKGIWSAVHELGHNQQRGSWQIMPHTFEAVCNVWAVYVHEKVLSISRSKAHPELDDKARRKRIVHYLENGSDLQNWQLWTCLETYLQLQEGFGWEAFIHIFSAYQKLSQVKNENTYKMNLWADMFSKEVKKNLVPFFKLWGWPIEDEITSNLSSFPGWDEDPMKKHALDLATMKSQASVLGVGLD
ncbi:TRPM8 channel-associated factor homolog [Ambystoma mexicanum]|uniref:TRPM8 channel-associated factor homolog n=1 Tax=Ambystoma mexicanum TaxID=8296 RepID=UPI0037E7679D